MGDGLKQEEIRQKKSWVRGHTNCQPVLILNKMFTSSWRTESGAIEQAVENDSRSREFDTG
ncbi:hypothetical protein P5673_014777 [Acropora cervicornis]|uniref:Uncharacterized protein n=1 Tax=Acropora cervicornis TaxID=6130 RepID=A0AAD9V5I5_ACRCE|nr:hypothetical protein P5673_014777 [Acropora cervicornis]